MDYHRPLNGSKCNPKVHIGLVLVPGIHTGTEKVSKSPLLINPGGPGGSGTEFAILFGRSLQQIIGEDRDIIGFDPRGVHTTTPRADCFSFPDNPGLRPPTYDDENFVRGDYHRFLWEQISGREIGIVNSSSVALQKLDLRARGMAELCQRKDKLYGEDSILKYVNTPNVARDMLSIIDAWDEWASTQNNATANLAATVEGMEDNPQSPTDESHSSDQDTKGKLVYWGFSYGVSYHSWTER
jgi:pimeloyl-ACP methyl ester carboxylesterase